MKNNRIKIPNNLKIIYVQKKKLLIIQSPLRQKVLKIQPELILAIEKDFLQINLKSDNKLKKKNPTIRALKSVAKSMIKQSIIETLYFFYTKLRLVGVGYRVTDLKKINEKLLVLKLGYSHSIFFQVPNDTTISHLKQTNFSFSNTSFARVTQLAAFIRSYKKPEPYKGKGILHQNEKILLKEGKKV